MVNVRQIALSLAALLPLAAAAPTQERQAKRAVPGKYIVTLKNNVNATSHLSWAREVHSRSLGKRDTTGVGKSFQIEDFSAYAGEFDEATLEQIKNNPDVRQPGPLRALRATSR